VTLTSSLEQHTYIAAGINPVIKSYFFFFYGASNRFRDTASPIFFLSEASVEVSRQIQVLQGKVVSPTLNPQTGGPVYPFLSGSSPLTCAAWEPLPVAVLLPAQLSGYSDHASLATTSK
jgi:hypothetical protein